MGWDQKKTVQDAPVMVRDATWTVLEILRLIIGTGFVVKLPNHGQKLYTPRHNEQISETPESWEDLSILNPRVPAHLCALLPCIAEHLHLQHMKWMLETKTQDVWRMVF